MTLNDIAKKMCAKGKGILAADESTGTIAKRFKSINVENSEKNRLNFRQTLFNSSAMKDFIGGVILFDETIKQKTALGPTVPELISKHGAIPGIKVDKGAKPMAGSIDETVTEGLDGLRERLKEYYNLGARFTKWRAVYKISDKFPSTQSIKSNAHALARYAALVQEAKMVPIVEPEVLMDGSHNIDKCYQVTTDVLNECYNELEIHKVDLKGTVLKPNMVIPGSECKDKSSSEEIAKKTLDCLKKNVPSDVPGIAFLSGGQSEMESSKNLNEINKINDSNFLITFSYGRGLQASALKEFGKDQKNTENIQKAFNHRAKMNGLSSKGEWSENLEKESAAQPLKRLVYLISPSKIKENFYSDLNEVLAFKNVKFFQLRLKKIKKKDLLQIINKVKKITIKHNVKLILNDNFILANKTKVDGCHMGQRDGSFKIARKKLKRKILGITCHGSKTLAEEAYRNNADYIAFGSFFKSKLKPGAKKANISIIRWAKKKIKKPIVVIGGINNLNYKKLINAGAKYIAISSFIWDNPKLKPELAIRKFK